MTEDDKTQRTLKLVADVVAILEENRIPHALVGAAALAVHGYSRSTEDVDVGIVSGDLSLLSKIADEARVRLAVEAAVALPDGDDPLGGVVTLTRHDVRQVQVVNFVNPIGIGDHPGREGVIAAEPCIVGGAPVNVVDLAHLVAMKLFAGGMKSHADVVELMSFNPDANLDAIGETCARFNVAAAWAALLPEIKMLR